MDYRVVTLETLNSGAVVDLFNYEWDRMLENIQDPNTKPDDVRKIKIEVTVKPGKERDNATTKVSVSASLAKNIPHESFIVLGGDRGQLKAFTTDPKQQDLDIGIDDGAIPFQKKA